MNNKNIRKEHFSTSGMIIVTILGSIGLLLVYFSGIFNVYDYTTFYECISKNGMLIIFGGFFLGISIYCWISFFRNVIKKPKKEIMYLLRKENNESIFINKKGKAFTIKDCYKEENKYYYVLKTHDYIYEILEECNEILSDWPLVEKKSYWLNFYSPVGNYENMLLLPIVYVILLPGILSILMSEGYQKIPGIILSAIPLYVIGYDLIYKLKLKKSKDNYVDDSALINSYMILQKSISIITALILCFILITIFSKLSDLTSIIIFLPFLLCGVCASGTMLSKTFGNFKLENIFLKSYVIIFLMFWFGMIIFFTIEVLKENNNYTMILFTVPFWIFGIYAFYKYIIKK